MEDLEKALARAIADYRARLDVLISRKKLLDDEGNKILLSRRDPIVLSELRQLLEKEKHLVEIEDKILNDMADQYLLVIKKIRFWLDQAQRMPNERKHAVGNHEITVKELREFLQTAHNFAQQVLIDIKNVYDRIILEEKFLSNPNENNIRKFLDSWNSEIKYTIDLTQDLYKMFEHNERKGVNLIERAKRMYHGGIISFGLHAAGTNLSSTLYTKAARFPRFSPPWIVLNIIGAVIYPFAAMHLFKIIKESNIFYILELEQEKEEIKQLLKELQS